FLDPGVAARLRAVGTCLLGYAFDDAIFAGSYTPQTWAALQQTYDRYVTTSEVRWATSPREPLPELPPEHDVVLVGRAYDRRIALVEALRRAGFSVEARGQGWPGGFVARAAMLELYSRAAVVLTTADWEHLPVPMVKHRLLDTAMLGVFQLAQQAPDLRRYFNEEEVPAFGQAAELVDLVTAALADAPGRRASARAARQRALAEHTWSVRFAELLGPLTFTEAPARSADRSQLFDQLLLALATRAEADGRIAAAAALCRQLLARQPAEPTAAAVLGRCLRDLGRIEEALPWLRLAAAVEAPPAASAIHAALPPCGVGTGLGRFGLLPPAAEPTVYLLAALLEQQRIADALQLLDGLDPPALAGAVAATLDLGPHAADDPALAPVQAGLARHRRR
ncbi:MAG: glycosyltransferase family 1 protein, partial [Deltaproteobacteria bacterium]|nr:glycosyltransferase family 1 protein [Deltaproteobacteria bacterium]